MFIWLVNDSKCICGFILSCANWIDYETYRKLASAYFRTLNKTTRSIPGCSRFVHYNLAPPFIVNGWTGHQLHDHGQLCSLALMHFELQWRECSSSSPGRLGTQLPYSPSHDVKSHQRCGTDRYATPGASKPTTRVDSEPRLTSVAVLYVLLALGVCLCSGDLWCQRDPR